MSLTVFKQHKQHNFKQHNLKTVSDMLNKWELKIYWRKTKVMRETRDSEEFEVKIGDEVIEQVETMKYLGVMVSNDRSMKKEKEARIGNATRVIGGMNE